MWSNGETHGLIFLGIADQQADSGSSALSVELKARNTSSPRQAGCNEGSLTIQSALEEARIQIARSAGVPSKTVRLKLEIDF